MIIKLITHGTQTPEDMFLIFITVALGVAWINHVKFSETNFAELRRTAPH
jgi:hypothetical protein